ncbi:MAG: beta-lactamase family protein [Defluviitaleaceae bacterium]|nr:beta-lactamase family protein [Defluviitaleaceae bacterium]
MPINFNQIWQQWGDADKFSGVFSVYDEKGPLFEKSGGFRNRNENLPNNSDTAFAIASGTKMFTGLAVCKLIDDGKLSLEDKIHDILSYDLGQIDERVTVFHLLTHTSGIGDYIDEEDPDCGDKLQALNEKYPVYLWKRLEYYLPMIAPLPPKFEPGKRYGYSNAGFIMLGLVIEAVSGIPYQQYVQDNIITPCGLTHTGFYSMDVLPGNTALGYMQDEETGQWKSNIFSMPIVGGSDGGLFTCAGDLNKLWRAVFSNKILSEEMTQSFLKAQVIRDDKRSYGLGVYRTRQGSETIYYAVGGDCGVDFFTAYFPKQKIVASALGNTDLNTYPLFEAMVSTVDV